MLWEHMSAVRFGHRRPYKFIMKLLKNYFDAKQELFDYFGYVEDWVVIPLDDATQYYWSLSDPQVVMFADTVEELESGDGNCYSNSIYHQRFLPKTFYRGAEYTMIVVDTHTDGNKFLQIFDNSKEVVV